ncbi:hypothetical protein VPHK469_0089 [Vibrio phage K469]
MKPLITITIKDDITGAQFYTHGGQYVLYGRDGGVCVDVKSLTENGHGGLYNLENGKYEVRDCRFFVGWPNRKSLYGEDVFVDVIVLYPWDRKKISANVPLHTVSRYGWVGGALHRLKNRR